MDGWWPDRLLGQGPDNRTCVRLRHAGCPAQGPPDTPAKIKTTWWWIGRDGYGNPVPCVGTTEKTLSAPAKNTHLLILTSHKTAAFTINNKASVLFYSSGKNGGGVA